MPAAAAAAACAYCLIHFAEYPRSVSCVRCRKIYRFSGGRANEALTPHGNYCHPLNTHWASPAVLNLILRHRSFVSLISEHRPFPPVRFFREIYARLFFNCTHAFVQIYFVSRRRRSRTLYVCNRLLFASSAVESCDLGNCFHTHASADVRRITSQNSLQSCADACL